MSAELQTLATFSNPVEAELVLNRLTDEGVPAQLVGDLTGNLFGVGYAVGGMDLLVPESEMERSRIILATLVEEHEQRKEQETQKFAAAPDDRNADIEDRPPPRGEVLTGRAFRASWLGFLLCSPIIPLAHVYSLVLLLIVALGQRNAPNALPPRFYFALVIDIIALAIAAVLYGFAFGS